MALFRIHQLGHARGICRQPFIGMAVLSLPSSEVRQILLTWCTISNVHLTLFRALEAQTNVAHRILAKLSIPNLRKAVAPSAQSFHLITQNVDRLSVRALHEVEKELEQQNLKGPGYRSRKDAVLQMHGKLFEVQCTKCDWRAEDFSSPLCPALGKAEEDINDYTDAGSKDHAIPLDDLPRCPECHALARPGVVWFGEKPYHLDEINLLVFKADMCIVIGTSSTVRTPLLFVSFIQRSDITDLGETSVDLCVSCPAPSRACCCFQP